ncbi:dihydrofolate reductase family protein [Nocardia coffeae]|uniref:dihydrofolate reductase family protein n=1 Tax=Nocardia coffeae TaxID=2873381 RepID=UPI001F35F136|nr:dihydrofolate reductase family protein [Nocardia coffeae]
MKVVVVQSCPTLLSQLLPAFEVGAAGQIEPAAALGNQALQIGVATGSGRIMERVNILAGMIDPASSQTAILTAGLADELHLAVAPLLVGQADAPRFVNPAEFPGGSRRRMQLVEVSQIGDVALLRYFPKNDSEDN